MGRSEMGLRLAGDVCDAPEAAFVPSQKACKQPTRDANIAGERGQGGGEGTRTLLKSARRLTAHFGSGSRRSLQGLQRSPLALSPCPAAQLPRWLSVAKWRW